LISRFQSPGGLDARQLEVLLRVAIFKPANQLVEHLFQARADQVDAAYQSKPGLHYKGREKVRVQGIFGCFDLERDYYYDPKQKRGHFPSDAALGLEAGYTPALARLMCLESIDEQSFEKAQKHLKETGGIDVPAGQLQRLVQEIGPGAQQWQERQTPPDACDAPILYVSGDGTGVRMRKEELAGRKGKQEDGSAKTRQAYLGCVFTQHKRDEKGRPIRDHESTSYISTFGTVEDLGLLLRWEARRRGSGTAGKIVLLIDGALGLEHHGQINFPGCLQIVDFYHAMEHLQELLEALWGKAHPKLKTLYGQWTKRLLKDGVQNLIDYARTQSQGQSTEATVIKALNYFEHNVRRMQYGTFRKKGYFIGSGVVEAGCKTVIGARCKQSGMFWSQAGAQNVLALRCIERSRQWESFWKSRAHHHSARNDSLCLSA
jgi:hypothetical protein